MYDYDRKSLETYANTIEQVTNLGNQYQQEKSELEGMKQEYEAESANLQTQIDTKKANSADCDNEIAYAQEMANEYANLIQEQQRKQDVRQKQKPLPLQQQKKLHSRKIRRYMMKTATK